ncbi:autoinducer synthesis protein [Rhizobium sp. Root564]|nr:autoinducer synthesis protein [Rhizobium sp. Root564]
MQIMAISTPRNSREEELLRKQHILRGRVFGGRLGWEVDVQEGIEKDRFDQLDPTYILAVQGDRHVVGCARLIPAAGPTMVRDVFSALLPDQTFHAHKGVIESSRFCVDTQSGVERGEAAIHAITLSMFAGIIEWSIEAGYSEIVTVTDLRFERILSRVGWPLCRLAPPKKIGVTTAVAGTLPADRSTLIRLRPPHYKSTIATTRRHAA